MSTNLYHILVEWRWEKNEMRNDKTISMTIMEDDNGTSLCMSRSNKNVSNTALEVKHVLNHLSSALFGVHFAPYTRIW